jgi:DNA-directed RNA polymerase subunit alpha
MSQFQFDKIESCQTDLGEQTTRFLLKELVPGQGLTIGNTLRRVLLSELEGTAITAVKINGIKSEFSVIPGVREDVLELILNLKQIKFQGLIATPFITLVTVQGPSVITSSNISLPPDLQMLNPSQYIATVSEQVSFELELKIESGKGYRLVDYNSTELPSDFLNIDSIFTPIKTVNFDITESYKIGEARTEVLDLEITTNGSTSPKEVLKKAAQNLQTLFGSLIVDESSLILESETEPSLNVLIEELDLSVRAYNCLKAANIHSLTDLIEYSVKDLKKIKNFGKKSATEVVDKLQDRFGVCLN